LLVEAAVAQIMELVAVLADLSIKRFRLLLRQFP
jgi:hypothetical protein